MSEQAREQGAAKTRERDERAKRAKITLGLEVVMQDESTGSTSRRERRVREREKDGGGRDEEREGEKKRDDREKDR